MPVMVGPVRVSGVPSLVSSISTISNGRSHSIICRFNSKVHMSSTASDPSGQMGLGLVLVSVIDSGAGTENITLIFYHHIDSTILYNI